MVMSLVPTAEGGNIQRHQRPARQQVRCASFTQTRSFGQRFLCLCLSLSLSIHQVLRSSNAWLSTPGRWGRGNALKERKGLGRAVWGFLVLGWLEIEKLDLYGELYRPNRATTSFTLVGHS